jgi:signal transduction histidine kinase
MLVSAIPPAYIVYLLQNERDNLVVPWFQISMLCGLVWSISFGLIALVESPILRFVITNVYIIAVPLSAISWFIFCYEFTFRKAIPKRVFLLFVPVVFLFVFSWFNPYNLIYTVEYPYLTEEILIPANQGSIRPVINVGMGYLLVIMSAGMVLGEWMSSPQKVRKTQAQFIFISTVILAILGMIKVLDIVPPYFDPTPIGWTLSSLLFAISIKRYHFLQLSSAAPNQIINEIQEIIIILNPNGIIADLNCAAADVLDIEVGMTESEFKIQNPEYRSVINGYSSTPIEINSNNITRVLDKQSSVLEYTHGAEGEIIILRDITELNKKERELREQNERLDEFVNEVTHDLRGPLTVASGHLELAKMEDDSIEHLNKVQNAHQRIEQLVQDARAKARGNDDLTREQLSLSESARTAWKNIDTATVSLEIEDDRTVEADSGQILRLLENLFRNSVEHGGKNVTVRVGSTSSGFFVADTGPGIPEDKRQRIFERNVTYSDQGTGYGLAIVMDIIDDHGWSISVQESEEGGARFEIAVIEPGEQST